MLTLAELYELLDMNERETLAVIADKTSPNTLNRLLELSLHRTLVKSMIIEQLESQLAFYEVKKAA